MQLREESLDCRRRGSSARALARERRFYLCEIVSAKDLEYGDLQNLANVAKGHLTIADSDRLSSGQRQNIANVAKNNVTFK